MAVAREIGVIRIDPANPVFETSHRIGTKAETSGIYQCGRCEGEGVHTSDTALPPCPHCRDEDTVWHLIVVPKHLHTPAGKGT